MKMPVWVWNKAKGRYETFPYHLLTTFEDGTQGIDYSLLANWNDKRLKEQFKVLEQFPQLFMLTKGSTNEYRRYILKAHKRQCKHKKVRSSANIIQTTYLWILGVLAFIEGCLLILIITDLIIKALK